MSVFFPQIGQYGRLGNQLFQYAAGRSLALKHNTNLCIYDPSYLEWHGQKCLLNNLNINVKYIFDNQQGGVVWNEPNPFLIEKGFFDLPNNIALRGFFQSTYYFDPYQEQIKKELTPKNLDSNFVDDLRKEKGKPIVSIHVRRGDNTDGTDPSQTALREMYSKGGIYEEYINKATSLFKDVHFLVFTGGKRGSNDNSEDISWCRNFFSGDNFSFSESRSVMQDFCSIISCDSNIIGHVSSFGWWAAFLNSNPTKVVVAPENYHPDIPNFTHRFMFYPENWILI